MNAVQIGSAAWCRSGRAAGCRRAPTQTTVSSSGVKPTNQASRRSLVVPDLPAASSVKPAPRAPAPVPLVEDAAHHVGDEERRVGLARPFAAPSSQRQVLALATMPRDASGAGGSCRRSGTACRPWRSRTASPRTRRARSTGYGRGGVPTPTRFHSAATSVVAGGSATLIVAMLRESASARRSVIGPSYSFS